MSLGLSCSPWIFSGETLFGTENSLYWNVSPLDWNKMKERGFRTRGLRGTTSLGCVSVSRTLVHYVRHVSSEGPISLCLSFPTFTDTSRSPSVGRVWLSVGTTRLIYYITVIPESCKGQWFINYFQSILNRNDKRPRFTQQLRNPNSCTSSWIDLVVSRHVHRGCVRVHYCSDTKKTIVLF